MSDINFVMYRHSPWNPLIPWGPLLFDILGRSESALWELGCAEIHGGLPPAVRRPLC